MTRRLTIVLVIVLVASYSIATTRYIAQTAGTFSGGTACNGQTAITPATFNGITSSAGDINWICGTITGSANATLLTPLGNGSAGNVIQLNWDTGAILTAPYWNTSVGTIDLDGLSYWTLDGKGTGVAASLATGGNPATAGANGIIACSANGTSLANQQSSENIHISSTDHIIIKNLWFENNYVRVANTAGSAGFDAVSINGTNATNLLVTNNWITNSRQLVGDAFTASGGGFEVSFNYTFATEVPTSLASVSSNVTWTGAKVHDNHFAGGVDQWDDPTSNSFHHDGGAHNFCQGVTACHINGYQYYNNLTDGIWGNDAAYYVSSGGGTHITTYFYPEQTGGDTTIFNNVFNRTAGDARYTSADNGDIFCKLTSSPGATCAIYNNTFIGPAGNTSFDTNLETDAQTVAANMVAKNNIFTQNGGAWYLDGAASTTVTATNNDYYQIGTNPGWNFGTFANWQSAGQDPSPAINGSNPKLNTDGTLQAGSSAIGIGANLTSLGIAALDSDIVGALRPSSAAWDAGAFCSSSTCAGTQASPATCSPTSGVVPQTVTCTNPNSGTTVACYTTNGGTPATAGNGTSCTTGTVYTTTISVSVAETIKIIAGTSTLTDSSVNVYSYVASSGATGAGITQGVTMTTGTGITP